MDIGAAREKFLASVAAGPTIMGIVNVTPDSFLGWRLFVSPGAALAQSRKLVADGAAIVDVGAESTRPGHSPVPADEEWARLEPLLASLVSGAGAPVSVDTYKAQTARRALQTGVAVVNDVWGLQRDPQMASVVAEAGAAVVIMHNRESVDPAIDIVSDMQRFFERSLGIARAAGVPERHILLDPGVGFGKSREQKISGACRDSLARTRGLSLVDRRIAQINFSRSSRWAGRRPIGRHARGEYFLRDARRKGFQGARRVGAQGRFHRVGGVAAISLRP